jgi:xanthine dehydrogenase accessory factor
MSVQATRILDLMESLREEGRAFCAVTIVRTAHATSAKAGAKALVTDDGALHGFVGGGCVQGAVKRAALAALESGEPRLIRVKPREDVLAEVDADGAALYKSSCPSGGTVDLFLEPMRLAPALVVCGASPVAAALVRLAQAMDCRVIVAAPSELHGEVPGASSYVDGFALETIALEPRDAVVVVTQGRRDREALSAALRSPARYVGMVGSRRKIARLREGLAGEIPAARLAALKGPAGLDIGAIEPEEIALSILGELVRERRHATTVLPVSASG